MFERMLNTHHRVIDSITIVPHDTKALHIPMDYLTEKLNFEPVAAELYVDRENHCIGYKFVSAKDSNYNYRVFRRNNCFVLNLSSVFKEFGLPKRPDGTYFPEHFWDRAMLVINLSCMIKSA